MDFQSLQVPHHVTPSCRRRRTGLPSLFDFVEKPVGSAKTGGKIVLFSLYCREAAPWQGTDICL
jgi:hypothetical protein